MKESRWLFLGLILINIIVTGCGTYWVNTLRTKAMEAARVDRQQLSRKLDAAWVQREMLTERTIQACRNGG